LGDLQMVGDRTPGRECDEQTVRRAPHDKGMKRRAGDLAGCLVDHRIESDDSPDHPASEWPRFRLDGPFEPQCAHEAGGDVGR
jgi:hypothetical protein